MVTETVVAIVTEVAAQIEEVIEALREQPEVQAVAVVSTPAVIAASVGSVVVLTSSFSLWPFLQYLFTAPLMFIARRRRQQFGVVYHAITKVPVDLAIVRLINAKTGKLFRTRVTDGEGRYFFKADSDRYRMEVVKQGMTFPSTYLKGQTSDGKYLDVYLGEDIEVKDKDVVITANIPMDPEDAPERSTARAMAFKRFMRVFQHVLAASSLVLSAGIWLVRPSTITATLFFIQLVVYVVTFFLVRPRKKKGWGIVRENKKRSPLKNVVVRLFEPKYNKLIETTLTDQKGRYAFLAGSNEYYVTYEKPGYQKEEVRPIDYTKKEEPEPIAIDVNLIRGSGARPQDQTGANTV